MRRPAASADAERARGRPGIDVVIGDDPTRPSCCRGRRRGRLARLPAAPPAGRVAAAGRRARRLQRAGAGLAAARPGRARWLARHRHQRQDHHHHHARRDPARGRACARRRWATSASRWWTPRRPATTCWPSSCPASSCTGRRTLAPAGRRAAQPGRRPPRLARRLRRVRRGEDGRSGAAAPAASRSATSTIRCVRRSGWRSARPAAGSASPSGVPAAGQRRRGRGHAGRPDRRRRRASSWPPWPTIQPGGAHNVANALAAAALALLGRRAARGDPAPGWPATCPSRTATRSSPRSTGCPTSTTARPPTRTRRRPRCGVHRDRVGRRRAAQGRRHRRAGRAGSRRGWPARCCSASTGRRSPRRSRDTRRACRWWRWPGPMMARWGRSCSAAARAGRAGRHRAARPGRGVAGHVRQLRPPRRRVRRGGAGAASERDARPRDRPTATSRRTATHDDAPSRAPAGPPMSAGGAARRCSTGPLASYYLLLASAGLLLVIGLAMVFSATSVEAFAPSGNAFASIAKQVVAAVVGLVAFWICQRLPRAHLPGAGPAAADHRRSCCWSIMDVLALLHAVRGARRRRARPGPRRRAVALPRPAAAAAVRAGEVRAGAVGRRRAGPQGPARSCGWRELVTPLFPVVGLLFVLVGYNDLGTMLCLLILFVGLLWAAGVPAAGLRRHARRRRWPASSR